MSQHYFTRDPDGPDHRTVVTATAWGRTFELTTATGVFARGGLDKGTAVLLARTAPPTPTTEPRAASTTERSPAPVAGTPGSDGPLRLLDLGCGYGPIAIALALACPTAEVWAVDINLRALELTRLNAEANGVADRVHAVEAANVPTDLGFDQLWSNPPIHPGKAALHGLLETWLPRTRGPGHLVVARNLGADSLQTWLNGEGYPTARVASSKGFRVLVTQPRTVC